MKIVLVSDQYLPRISGQSVSVGLFLREFNKLGHEAYLFAPTYPGYEDIPEPLIGERVLRFPSFPVPVSKGDRLVWLAMKRKVFKALDKIGPDIVHIQTEFTLSQMVLLYCKHRRIPAVMTYHTYWEEYIRHYFPWLPDKASRRFIRYVTLHIYNQADRIIVPTRHMQEVLSGYGVNRPIEIIPTGIDPADFSGLSKPGEKEHSRLYEQYPSLKGKRVLLFAGRIAHEKNIDFLIPVVLGLAGKYENLVCVIAGDGPYREKLKRKIADRKASPYFLFTGAVKRDQLKYYYTLADVFVFPSKSETQGLVSIEAMLCATPVVAIGRMGTIDVMNGDNGGFMTEDDEVEFSEKVDRLLADPDLYVRKSQEAISYAQGWTVSGMAERIINLYIETTVHTRVLVPELRKNELLYLKLFRKLPLFKKTRLRPIIYLRKKIKR